MKNRLKKRVLAFVLCLAMGITLLPTLAFAEEAAPDTIEQAMTEGEIIAGFSNPETTNCSSTDPSVAWVDAEGNLKAMKEGTATIVSYDLGTGITTNYEVTVNDYTDGSEVVGKLKLLARYNDSMQFYDGHVYLLFTSYQDGVDITVPDLYGAYIPTAKYYEDINADIANGSNHTGNDADQYFTFTKDLQTMTLNRGEIVTIGMYRGFDLSIPQAALGSLKNSSAWAGITKAGKTAAVEAIFQFLDQGAITDQEALDQLKKILDESGTDIQQWMDGVVEGGLCLNRELYNQKLEWDQFENVTYELDITANQLKMLTMYLQGNLNNFSILANSCATVAIRAWNAAVGTRNGEDTAYKMDCKGDGIFAYMDAPKGVRDNMVQRLPGYYLNNAENVAEPDASFQDDTGFVYVSAPEKVSPLNFVYADETYKVDPAKTNEASLVAAAKAGQKILYGIDEQKVDVKVAAATKDDVTTISGIDYTINGTTVSLNADNAPADGIWFTTKVEPKEGESCYVTDVEGEAIPSEYADGYLSFYASSLPFSFKIAGSTEGARNPLTTTIVKADEADYTTEVYVKNGEEKTVLADTASLASGTKVYVKSTRGDLEVNYLLEDITLNGASIKDAEHFDEAEGAYFFEMPEVASELEVLYERGIMINFGEDLKQLAVGQTLDATEVSLYIGVDAEDPSDQVKWKILADDSEETDVVEIADEDGRILKAANPGTATVWACAKDNENIGVVLTVEVYENFDGMCKVTFRKLNKYDTVFVDKATGTVIPFSGYMIAKGSELIYSPVTEETEGMIISAVTANGKPVNPGESIKVEEDTDIQVFYRDAEISGLPKSIKLATAEDTYQLNAKVKYKGLIYGLLPVYDGTIEYTTSDPDLISVDENGLVSVVGEIPEGGKAVYITATAASGNKDVKAECKVEVGDYDGGKVVGKATIYARSINNGQIVAHGCFAFTTYEDLDLNISFYDIFKTQDNYKELMWDYEDHPENYPSDPAIYSDEIDLGDRESYFDHTEEYGAYSEPHTVSMLTGETITLSNYGYETANLTTVLKSLENSSIADSKSAQALIEQIKAYKGGEGFDGGVAFDSLLETIGDIILQTALTGHNPADGISDGGIAVNREIHNEFVRAVDSQMPNNYYSMEVTADELAMMEAYLSNPDNNFYSLLTKNCATGARDIWNATFQDKDGLQLDANMTGLTAEPQSLYFELGKLRLNKNLGGEGGSDFYPKSVPSRHVWDIKTAANVMIASCDNHNIEHHLGQCKLTEEGLAVILTAEACDYAKVTAEGLDEFNAESRMDIQINEDFVKFYKMDGLDAVEVPAGTKDPGAYIAELTVGEGQVLKAKFVISEAGDYSKLEEVMKNIPEDLSEYTDESVRALEEALEKVDYTLTDKDQDKIDEMIKAVEDAIAGLEKRDQFLFDDVQDPNAWFFDNVYAIYNTKNANGTRIMSGYAGTNLFGPLDPVVRAQFAVMLHRLANEPDAAFDANIYGDVKNPEDFFATAVMWAREAKVITGYENGNFGPNDPLTREQLATILYRYAVNQKYDVSAASAKGDMSQFTDAAAVSPFAKDAVKWANGAGIVTGKEGPNGTHYMDPQGTASRAEVATMFMRYINYVEGLK